MVRGQQQKHWGGAQQQLDERDLEQMKTEEGREEENKRACGVMESYERPPGETLIWSVFVEWP